MIRTSDVPTNRIRSVNEASVRNTGDYVLYWMVANRRVEYNFALQRAVDWAQELALPLVIFEPLEISDRWAADRFHRFVIEGMADNLRRLDALSIAYYPHVEFERGASKELLMTLAARASIVITDDGPAFFCPAMVAAAAARLDVQIEAVDSCGLLPVSATGRNFTSAHSFRRFLQKELPGHLEQSPRPDPIAAAEIPRLTGSLAELAPGFRPTTAEALDGPTLLATVAIDHSVGVLPEVGGTSAARIRLRRFVDELLPEYGERRNQPDREHTSRLSAYLHFGHISSHEIFATIAADELWTPALLARTTSGARHGWWGMSASSEAFLDQLVTWRELGFNMCHHRDDHDAYSSLPDWARRTLHEHRGDERSHLYTADELESAATHDEIWNAAQSQLVVAGRIHNYMRMLWGKKILAWSVSPEQALRTMIELNNKYALDGRDPNSYCGIFWVLGRYDRPWGPERPVFGKVRYMTSSNTARKLRLRDYVSTHAPAAQQRGDTAPC